MKDAAGRVGACSGKVFASTAGVKRPSAIKTRVDVKVYSPPSLDDRIEAFAARRRERRGSPRGASSSARSGAHHGPQNPDGVTSGERARTWATREFGDLPLPRDGAADSLATCIRQAQALARLAGVEMEIDDEGSAMRAMARVLRANHTDTAGVHATIEVSAEDLDAQQKLCLQLATTIRENIRNIRKNR